MSSFQPVSVTRLYRMIAAQIGGKIQAGHFLPGSRLPSERDLAEQLEVSRTSVREALIALELEGLVEVRVGAGVFVSVPNARPAVVAPAEASAREWIQLHGDIGPFDLIKVQLLVEPECAAMAAANASEEAIARIVAAGRAMEGSDTPREHNRNFHITIAEATNNAAMAMTVTNLWNLHDESPMFQKLEQHFVNREAWLRAENEHEELMQAIVHRRPDDARLAMQAHFMGSQSRLFKAFPPVGNFATL